MPGPSSPSPSLTLLLGTGHSLPGQSMSLGAAVSLSISSLSLDPFIPVIFLIILYIGYLSTYIGVNNKTCRKYIITSEVDSLWWFVFIKRRPCEDLFLFQESLSLSSAIALNWCSTIACIRDYISQVHISLFKELELGDFVQFLVTLVVRLLEL